MDFDYTDEQRYLREESRRFLADACPLSRSRAIADRPEKCFDSELWRRIGEQGWLGIAIPESHGGLGLSHVELGAIAEEVGAALAPVPFGSTLYLLGETLLAAGSEEQQRTLLPQIAEGLLIGCAAIYEGPGDFAPGRIQTEFADGRLSGAKMPVVDGGIADLAVVLARESGRVGLYLAELGSASVTRTKLESIDGSMDIARLDFDRTPAERLPGSYCAETMLARAAILYAFEQIGAADRCLRMTIDYVKERQAFGGPVGRFQAVKHKLADIYTANELARSHVYHGVWAMDHAPDLLIKTAAAARIAATEAFWFAAKECVHLHGAIGFTWEHDAQLFYRRAHHLSLSLGAPQWWKDRLFDELLRQPGEPNRQAPVEAAGAGDALSSETV